MRWLFAAYSAAVLLLLLLSLCAPVNAQGGSCIAAGFSDCTCTVDCIGIGAPTCYCDLQCLIVNDCCSDFACLPGTPTTVVSGQSITSSLPAAFFTAGSGVDFVNGSVLQLFCTADSPSTLITWERGGTVLTNDPPHIRIRSNSDASTITSILTVDDFQTADNGAYQCRVGQTAMATTQTLTAFTPVDSDDTLFMFRHPNDRETLVLLSPPADNRSAVVLGATIDPDDTSGNLRLLRCVTAHINDVGQPLGTLVWTRNGQVLTAGARVTLTVLVFDATRYGVDLQITNFTESDAGIYQCIATDDPSSDSDVVTSPPFRLDTDLAGDVLRLERVSPEVILLNPPNKLVIEVKASGRYGNITWTKDGSPLVVDSPNELPNFAEIFVRGVTTASDLGTYTVQLTTLNATQTRQPESLEFQVVPPPTLMFSNMSLDNGSAVTITDIGEGLNDALICQTVSPHCCRAEDNPTGSTALGNWYFPSGDFVTQGGDIFVTREASRVRLNRRNDTQSPTGLYRCDVASTDGQVHSIFVELIEAVPSPPTSLASSSQSPTFITLSWEQPAGDVVDRYDIVYTYQGGCSNYTQPANMTTVNDGTAREYTLQNLQEFTAYSISIAAVNTRGSSSAATAIATTARSAPSGSPQSVLMSSIAPRSVTIQWGRVSCIDRNSEITGYTVRYGQTGGSTTVMEPVTGTSASDRVFTASGLILQTSYTFEFAAVSSEGTGPFSTGIAVETLEPETLLFQLRLTGSLNCVQWIADNIEAKRSSLRDTIISSIEEECQLQCGFSQSDITSDGFSQCFNSSAVTYRGTLHGTNTATASELAAYLEQWSAGVVAFPVQSLILTVDSSCTVLIESLSDPECLPRFTDASPTPTATVQSTPPATEQSTPQATEESTPPATEQSTPPATEQSTSPATDIGTTEAPSKTDNTASIVGGVVSVLIVTIVAVTILIPVLVLLILRRAPKSQIEEPVELRQYSRDDITITACSAYVPTANTHGQPLIYENPGYHTDAPEYEQIRPVPPPPRAPPPRVGSGEVPGQEGGGEEARSGGGTDD